MDASGSPVPAGAVLADQWSTTLVTLSCENNVSAHPNLCLAFDSAAPSGADYDLGTPHQDFGGPGIGAGGRAGEPGQNDTPLFNVLIVAEDDVDADGDGLIDDPDDEAQGGTLNFAFQTPVDLASITLVDIDNDEPGGGLITCTDAGGATLFTPIPVSGNNSVQTLNLAIERVVDMRVELVSSGAIAELVYQPSCASDVDADGVCDEDDNCIDTSNPTQSDQDSDGVGDACDPATCSPALVLDQEGETVVVTAAQGATLSGTADSCAELRAGVVGVPDSETAVPVENVTRFADGRFEIEFPPASPGSQFFGEFYVVAVAADGLRSLERIFTIEVDGGPDIDIASPGDVTGSQVELDVRIRTSGPPDRALDTSSVVILVNGDDRTSELSVETFTSTSPSGLVSVLTLYRGTVSACPPPCSLVEVEVTAATLGGSANTVIQTASVDRQPPLVTILSPTFGDGILLDGDGPRRFDVTVQVEDTLGQLDVFSIEVRANGRDWFSLGDLGPNGLITTDVRITTSGFVDLEARAADEFGNLGVASSFVEVLVDYQPPVIIIESPGQPLQTTTVPFDITVIDDSGPIGASGLTVLVDGVDRTADIPEVAEGELVGDLVLTEGEHVLEVTATDPVGRQTVRQRTFVADGTPPVLTLVPDLGGLHTPADQAAWEMPVVDTTEVVIRVNGFRAFGDPPSFGTGLSVGLNVFDIVATDAAGNETRLEIEIFRDPSPPLVTASILTGTLVNGVPGRIPFRCSGNVAIDSPFLAPTLEIDVRDSTGEIDPTSIRLLVDGLDLWTAPSTSSPPFTQRIVLQPGRNFVEVLASDLAGNTGTCVSNVDAPDVETFEPSEPGIAGARLQVPPDAAAPTTDFSVTASALLTVGQSVQIAGASHTLIGPAVSFAAGGQQSFAFAPGHCALLAVPYRADELLTIGTPEDSARMYLLDNPSAVEQGAAPSLTPVAFDQSVDPLHNTVTTCSEHLSVYVVAVLTEPPIGSISQAYIVDNGTAGIGDQRLVALDLDRLALIDADRNFQIDVPATAAADVGVVASASIQQIHTLQHPDFLGVVVVQRKQEWVANLYEYDEVQVFEIPSGTLWTTARFVTGDENEPFTSDDVSHVLDILPSQDGQDLFIAVNVNDDLMHSGIYRIRARNSGPPIERVLTETVPEVRMHFGTHASLAIADGELYARGASADAYGLLTASGSEPLGFAGLNAAALDARVAQLVAGSSLRLPRFGPYLGFDVIPFGELEQSFDGPCLALDPIVVEPGVLSGWLPYGFDDLTQSCACDNVGPQGQCLVTPFCIVNRLTSSGDPTRAYTVGLDNTPVTCTTQELLIGFGLSRRQFSPSHTLFADEAYFSLPSLVLAAGQVAQLSPIIFGGYLPTDSLPTVVDADGSTLGVELTQLPLFHPMADLSVAPDPSGTGNVLWAVSSPLFGSFETTSAALDVGGLEGPIVVQGAQTVASRYALDALGAPISNSPQQFVLDGGVGRSNMVVDELGRALIVNAAGEIRRLETNGTVAVAATFPPIEGFLGAEHTSSLARTRLSFQNVESGATVFTTALSQSDGTHESLVLALTDDGVFTDQAFFKGSDNSVSFDALGAMPTAPLAVLPSQRDALKAVFEFEPPMLFAETTGPAGERIGTSTSLFAPLVTSGTDHILVVAGPRDSAGVVPLSDLLAAGWALRVFAVADFQEQSALGAIEASVLPADARVRVYEREFGSVMLIAQEGAGGPALFSRTGSTFVGSAQFDVFDVGPPADFPSAQLELGCPVAVDRTLGGTPITPAFCLTGIDLGGLGGADGLRVLGADIVRFTDSTALIPNDLRPGSLVSDAVVFDLDRSAPVFLDLAPTQYVGVSEALVAEFLEPVAAGTPASLVPVLGGPTVSLEVEAIDNTDTRGRVRYRPQTPLQPFTEYTVAFGTVSDLAGNASTTPANLMVRTRSEYLQAMRSFFRIVEIDGADDGLAAAALNTAEDAIGAGVTSATLPRNSVRLPVRFAVQDAVSASEPVGLDLGASPQHAFLVGLRLATFASSFSEQYFSEIAGYSEEMFSLRFVLETDALRHLWDYQLINEYPTTFVAFNAELEVFALISVPAGVRSFAPSFLLLEHFIDLSNSGAIFGTRTDVLLAIAAYLDEMETRGRLAGGLSAAACQDEVFTQAPASLSGVMDTATATLLACATTKVLGQCAAQCVGICDVETCDGADSDCDILVDEDFDQDGDGVTTCATRLDGSTTGVSDCDDSNPDVSPDESEICDGLDNDCNTIVDDGPTEVCNRQDDDCDGLVDENADLDGDTYTTCPFAFPPRTNGEPGSPDCDDTNPDVSPEGIEVCFDGLDNDCSSVVDDGPPEVCNGLDDDCSGVVDDNLPGTLSSGGDACTCFRTLEVCGDGIDNDCDDLVDEGPSDEGCTGGHPIDVDDFTCSAITFMETTNGPRRYRVNASAFNNRHPQLDANEAVAATMLGADVWTEQANGGYLIYDGNTELDDLPLSFSDCVAMGINFSLVTVNTSDAFFPVQARCMINCPPDCQSDGPNRGTQFLYEVPVRVPYPDPLDRPREWSVGAPAGTRVVGGAYREHDLGSHLAHELGHGLAMRHNGIGIMGAITYGSLSGRDLYRRDIRCIDEISGQRNFEMRFIEHQDNLFGPIFPIPTLESNRRVSHAGAGISLSTGTPEAIAAFKEADCMNWTRGLDGNDTSALSERACRAGPMTLATWREDPNVDRVLFPTFDEQPHYTEDPERLRFNDSTDGDPVEWGPRMTRRMLGVAYSSNDFSTYTSAIMHHCRSMTGFLQCDEREPIFTAVVPSVAWDNANQRSVFAWAHLDRIIWENRQLMISMGFVDDQTWAEPQALGPLTAVPPAVACTDGTSTNLFNCIVAYVDLTDPLNNVQVLRFRAFQTPTGYEIQSENVPREVRLNVRTSSRMGLWFRDGQYHLFVRANRPSQPLELYVSPPEGSTTTPGAFWEPFVLGTFGFRTSGASAASYWTEDNVAIWGQTR